MQLQREKEKNEALTKKYEEKEIGILKLLIDFRNKKEIRWNRISTIDPLKSD